MGFVIDLGFEFTLELSMLFGKVGRRGTMSNSKRLARSYVRALAETLEPRVLLSVTLDPIVNHQATNSSFQSYFYAPANTTYYVPITATTDQSAVSYTVNSSDAAVTATVVSNLTFLKLNVQSQDAGHTISGDLVLALNSNVAPLTVTHITTLVNQGFYNGLIIPRVINNFMMQMGSPNNNLTGGSSLGNIPDENRTGSIFSGDGQLAMANSGGTNTADSQFFITDGPQTFLNNNYTIFGQLLGNFNIRDSIMSTPVTTGNGDSSTSYPVTQIKILSASMVTNTTDTVLAITGSANHAAVITVTAHDGAGPDAVQTFTAYTSPVVLASIPAQTVHMNATIDTTSSSYDATTGALNIPLTVTPSNEPVLWYASTLADGGRADVIDIGQNPPVVLTASSAASIGPFSLRITPTKYFVGAEPVNYSIGVKTSSQTGYSSQSFSLQVVDNAPTLTTINTPTAHATQDQDYTITYDTLKAASNATDPDSDPVKFQIQTVNNGTLKKGGVAVTAGTTTLEAGESLVWHSNIGDADLINAFSVKAFDGNLASSTAVAVNIQTDRSNHTPTLTTITALQGANANSDFTISYATLLAASNAADIDSYDTVQFRIHGVTSGTLTKGGNAVVADTTTLASGESLVWHPATDAHGAIAAFTVQAWDGTAASTTPVTVNVEVGLPTLSTISTLPGGFINTPLDIPFATLLGASNAVTRNGNPVQFKIQSVTLGMIKKNGVAAQVGDFPILFSAGDTLTWIPATNATGVVTAFKVTAFDGAADTTPAIQVNVQVSAPPTLTAISALTNGIKDTPLTITYSSLLSKASITAGTGGTTYAFKITAVSSGTLTKNGTPVTAGTTTIATGESLVWTPASGVTGSQNAFTVIVTDGANYSTTPRQVTVTVAPHVTVDAVAQGYVNLAQNIPAGKTLIMPLTGSTPDSQTLSYTVTSSDARVTTTVMTGLIWVKFTIAGLGDMTFALFGNNTPITAGRIATLIDQNFYNGLTFHRIIPNFMAQGGDPTGDGSGGSGQAFDDEFNAQLVFSGQAQLAMANSGPDTNDSQFFITDGTQRELDYNHAIFGQLVSGFEVFSQLMSLGSSNGTPTQTVTISDASVTTNTSNAVLMVSAPAGVSATVTVTATNQHAQSASQTFTATGVADTVNDPPFLNKINNLTGVAGQSMSLPIAATEVDAGQLIYAWGITNATNNSSTTNWPVTGSLSGNVLTLSPNAGYTGTVTLIVGVAQKDANSRGSKYISSAQDLYDTQMITCTFTAMSVKYNGNALTSGQSAPLDFGKQITGATGSTRTLVLTNNSSTPLTFTGAVVPTGWIAIAPGLPTTALAAGASVSLTLRQVTTSGGVKNGVLRIVTSDSLQPIFDVNLTSAIGANFVPNLYRDLLGRGADSGGLAFWNNQLSTSALTPTQVISGFMNSNEYRTNTIRGLYRSILSREADSGGLNAWLTAFANGATVEQLSYEFYASNEYLAKHGGTNASLVSAYYQALLGRAADSAGAASWVAKLNTGTSRIQVVRQIALSSEGLTRSVQAIYQQYLHRAADASGLAHWVTELGAGGTRATLVLQFLSSTEYFTA